MNKQINKNNPTCNTQDIAFDIKYFLQDFYLAKFIINNNEVKILFDNGQIFSVLIKENKS
ncbi:MAG: hypothetical protein NC037_05265 [Bacteroides sp.]|nr:hypothetical protein [Bacillota bacterium]MCM1393324.1 hypothetical protein [[Eubacterium] siraeum]MCM1455916.1 hypothetical protein [Bacteroides sp.]